MWVVSFTPLPLPLYPGERASGTHFIEGWVDPRAGLDMDKWKFLTLPGLKLLSPPSRPARSQSLYRLSYPGSLIMDMYNIKLHQHLLKEGNIHLMKMSEVVIFRTVYEWVIEWRCSVKWMTISNYISCSMVWREEGKISFNEWIWVIHCVMMECDVSD
jgi:hypothetical protein